MKKKKFSKVGKLIRKEMVNRDLGVQEAAQLLGMPDYRYLWKIVSGAVGAGSGKYAGAIANFVGVEEKDLRIMDERRRYTSPSKGSR